MGTAALPGQLRLLDAPRTTRAPVAFWPLVALVALLAAAKAVRYDTLDPDCFWHLRVAAQLRHDGVGPVVDGLSFASSRAPWTPYSWLAELGMMGVWDAGGHRAAVLVQALLQAAFVLVLARACLERQHAPARLASIVAIAFGAYLSLPFLSFRPVTAALVILAACQWLVLRDERRRETSRGVWWVAPLTVALANVHPFVFLVPAAAALRTLGAVVERRSVRHRIVRRRLAITAAVGAASMATPMLPGMVRTAVFYAAHDTMVAGPVIAEMRRPGMVTACLITAALACVARRWHRVPTGHLLCIAAATALLFKMGRFAPVFAIATCPVLAATLPPLKDRLLAKPAVALALIAVLMAGLIRTLSALPARDSSLSAWLNRLGPDAPGYPCAAADFVADHVAPATGHLINEFSWGGYLAWRLGDRFQVLLDGRTQCYPAQLWRDTYLGSDADRAAFLATVQADAAVLPVRNSLFRDALIRQGWSCVYRDEWAEVLVPTGPEERGRADVPASDRPRDPTPGVVAGG